MASLPIVRHHKLFDVVAVAIEAILRRQVPGVTGCARTLGNRLEATLGVVLMATLAIVY